MARQRGGINIAPLTNREMDVLVLIAAGLTNRDIAEELFVGVSTVKKHINHIHSKLQVQNRIQAVATARALGILDINSDAPLRRVQNNIPAEATPFIGRQQELVELARLIDNLSIHLITILAPGGMGKTRLALAVAEHQLANFDDGVYFVPLMPLTSSDDIVNAIAEIIGLGFYDCDSPKQQVLNYFRDRHTLLVLDNFEHLLDGVSLLIEIMQVAPRVKILVTSREKLNLSSETIFVLNGLHFPERVTSEDVMAYDAVQLFVQSARRVRPEFEIQHDNRNTLVHICQLLSGMPLAIVLASGWLDTMSLARIAEEIQRDIDILETEQRDVPERQRSVYATFNYSWMRLSDMERDAFMRLSVFRDGFSPEAAGDVAGAELRLLRRLVSKSLVQLLSSDRYKIHELLRQFAYRQLVGTGDSSAACKAHCLYYANFLQQRVLEIKGHKQTETLDEIEADWSNVRAAWNWALHQKDLVIIGQMMEAVALFCDLRARRGEGNTLFQQAVEVLEGHEGIVSEPLWGELLVRTAAVFGSLIPSFRPDKAMMSNILQRARDEANMDNHPLYLRTLADVVGLYSEQGVTLLEKSLEGFCKQGDTYYAARVRISLIMAYWILGKDYAEQFDNCYRLYLDPGAVKDEAGKARMIYTTGFISLCHYRLSEAERYLQKAGAMFRRLRHWSDFARVRYSLGDIAFRRGDFEQAKVLLQEAAHLATDTLQPSVRHWALDILCAITCIEGDYLAGLQLVESVKNRV